ncbi:MAG: Rieske (2Fe-2S) protein [Bacteroidales bacterium]|nr:Rieske (2Fe-2S) protein [Bacteroidales bacterium]
MDRRDVIQRVLLGGAALIVIPSAFTSCEKKTEPDPEPTPGPGPSGSKITIDLSQADYSVLNTAGGSKIVQTLLIVNTGTTYVALSSVCTHEGCTVGYVSTAGNIQCPCHGSMFTTTGSVSAGPATTPLTSYPVNKSGNILTIQL